MMNIKLENEYLRENLRVRGEALNECQRKCDLLKQGNDELRACIESLKQNAYIIMNYDEYHEEEVLEACEAIDQAPRLSLAKIKADAIREMLDEVWRSDTERVDIEDYATNLEQDNERD